MAYRGMDVRPGDGMDDYLTRLGLFKKPMPTDETSLFRSASEQIYSTQTYHDKLKQCALAYIDRHPEKFEDMNDIRASIHALALLYRHDFVIYQEISKPPVNVTNFGYPKKVILCESFGNHFDCVYPRAFQLKAAVCQSLVYEMLYKGIFHMDTEVSAAVGLIRKQNYRAGVRYPVTASAMDYSQRSPRTSQSCPSEFERPPYPYVYMSDTKRNAPPETLQSKNGSNSDSFPYTASFPMMHPVSYYVGAPATIVPRTPVIVEVEEDEEVRNKEMEMAITGPPFPYRVAKALDPVVYRNIEYDVWLDDKKARVRSVHRIFQGSPFPPGSSCFVRLDNADDMPYFGIVQELSASGETAIVFLPQLGEKQQVQLDRLEGGPRNPMNAQEESTVLEYRSRTRRTTWTTAGQNSETRPRSNASYSWPPTAPAINLRPFAPVGITPLPAMPQPQQPAASPAYDSQERAVPPDNVNIPRTAPVTVVSSPICYPLMAQRPIAPMPTPVQQVPAAMPNGAEGRDPPTSVTIPHPVAIMTPRGPMVVPSPTMMPAPTQPPILPNIADLNLRWPTVPTAYMQTPPSNFGMQMPLRPVNHPPTAEDMTTLSQFYRLGGCEYFRQLMAASQQNLPAPMIPPQYPGPVVVSPEHYPPSMGLPMPPMSFQQPSTSQQPLLPQ